MGVEFRAQSLYFGWNAVTPEENVKFTSENFQMVLRNHIHKSRRKIEIPITSIVKCVCHLEIRIIIMIYVHPICGDMIRQKLHMKSEEIFQHRNLIIIETEYSDAVCKMFKDVIPIYDEISLKDIEKMLNSIKSRKRKQKSCDSDICLQYPSGVGRISIYVADYKLLACDENLNDTIINYYIQYLKCEILTDEQLERTHIFDTFFYSALLITRKNSIGKQKKRIERWTKNLNIFHKDFIIVPINQSEHWYLAIICFAGLVHTEPESTVIRSKRRKVNDRGLVNDVNENNESSTQILKKPCILIFDSLSHGESNMTVLREFLNFEYKQKINDNDQFKYDSFNLPEVVLDVPHQNNTSDCGVFMLHYMELFIKSPPIKNFNLPIKNLENWFECSEAAQKRRDIAELIKRHILISSLDDTGNSFDTSNLPHIRLPVKIEKIFSK